MVGGCCLAGRTAREKKLSPLNRTEQSTPSCRKMAGEGAVSGGNGWPAMKLVRKKGECHWRRGENICREKDKRMSRVVLIKGEKKMLLPLKSIAKRSVSIKTEKKTPSSLKISQKWLRFSINNLEPLLFLLQRLRTAIWATISPATAATRKHPATASL